MAAVVEPKDAAAKFNSQVDEQIALLHRAEAVELERVLAHVQVRLDGQLVGVAAQHRRRRLHEVADAVHVEDEAGRRQARTLAAQSRDHAAAIRGAVTWQMATASASEA